ncbi:hypothetical protein B0H14DRAFT_3537683 [Mycena olivaceomarginata]|nr:hypothetical protein B0H14DRAFT_3537683 [Mycena olivaceomarginata]
MVRMRNVCPRHLLVDIHGHVFAVLAGQLCKHNYQVSVHAAYNLIIKDGIAAGFSAHMQEHRHGLFATINITLTYGKGCTVPSWLNNKDYDPLTEHLLANPNINRLANFASRVLASWALRLYQHYHDNNQKFHTKLPHLRHPCVGLIFSCTAFNFDPNAWTFRHWDILNLAFGWCTIQALSDFGPTKGRHLVLWVLMFIIEFPPSTLVLIPSTTLSHSNMPTQPGNTHTSFTQFTAGGLFQYVDNRYQMEVRLPTTAINPIKTPVAPAN